MESRREFIKKTAAGVMAAGWALKLAATNGFVSDSRPIHVFTKCLQFLDFHQLAEVLGRIGFDGADLSVRKGGQILPEKVESELSKWVNELKKTGVRCNMIVTGINNPNDKFTEPVLKSMSKLGIRHYRMGYLEYDSKLSIPQNLENHKLTFENLEKLNRKYNVTGNYQNHSGKRVGGPVWDLYHILKDRDPQFIGVQYDVRHATVEGGESWPIGMKLLAPWIKTTDIKDFIWEKDKSGVWKVKNVPLGEGMVNFNIYLGLVKELNIEGPVSIHYEYDLGGAEHGNVNPAMGLPQIEGFLSKDLSYLRNRFEKYGL